MPEERPVEINPYGNQTREWWVHHMITMHAMMPDSPSGRQMMEYDGAFFKVMEDHRTLHQRFYTGHEHMVNGLWVVGRTK